MSLNLTVSHSLTYDNVLVSLISQVVTTVAKHAMEYFFCIIQIVSKEQRKYNIVYQIAVLYVGI